MGPRLTVKRRSPFGPSLDGVIRGGNIRRRRKIRLGPIPRAAVALLLLYALVSSGAWAVAELRLRGDAQEVTGLEEPNGSDTNILIAATAGESPRVRLEHLVLLHVAGSGARPIGIYIPPDLRVRLDEDRSGKIADSIARGPSGIVKAVSSFTRLPIHHYVGVRRDELGNIAKSLGGLPLRDLSPNSAGGCMDLEGEELMRRIDDPSQDPLIGLRKELAAVTMMARKISRKAFLLIPWRLAGTSGGLEKMIQTDSKLSLLQVIKFSRGTATVDVDLRSIPISEPAARIGGVTYVIANERQTRALLDSIAKHQPVPDFGKSAAPSVERAELSAIVLNGTGVEGLAKKVADQMVAAGFPPSITANATEHQSTTVYFRPGAEQRAKIVAAMFDAGVKPLTPNMSAETDVTIVIGEDLARGETVFDPSAVPEGQGEPAGGTLGYC